MAQESCEICGRKIHGRRDFFMCETNQAVLLCKNHDREMFLMGEIFMLIKYPDLASRRTIKESNMGPYLKKIAELVD